MQVNDLLHSSSCGIHFRPKCCCLNCTLFLAIPINGTLVDKVKNSSNRASRKHVMKQILVDVVQKCNMLSKQLWTVFRDDFLDIAIDKLLSIVSDARKCGEVWLFNLNLDHSMLHLVEIRIDMLAMFKMSNMRGNTETR